MPNQRSADQVAITVYVPRDLKARVQERAEERADNLTALVVRAMKRYVR